MKLEVLLSAMHLQDENYIDSLNICSDCVVINQCDRDDKKDVEHVCIDGTTHKVRYIESTQRGLSKSRNMAIGSSTADICILCDNDVEYVTGYEQLITEEFAKHPEADVIVFYIKRPEKPVPNFPSERKMNYLSVLKIFSPEIAFRRQNISDISFDELFGAGAKYPIGEENIFLYNCLQKGKTILYVPKQIATLREEESTWFKGYTKDFFITRGANYYAMSPLFSHILIWQFALRKISLYKDNLSPIAALMTMYEGRRRYKKEIKQRETV